MVGERLRNNAVNDDPCNIFGKNVAAKLKILPRETRIYTEKLINDILFEAELGNVNKNTKIITDTNDSRDQTVSQLNLTRKASVGQSQYNTYLQPNEYHLPRTSAYPMQPTQSTIHQLDTNPYANAASSFFENYVPNNNN